VILSTIRALEASRPFVWLGSIRTRNGGASVGSVVKAQMVIEAVASKLSSCTDHGGSRLTGVVSAPCDGPDLAAFHASSRSEIDSMKV